MRAYAAERRLADRKDATNPDVEIAQSDSRADTVSERDFSPGIVEVWLARPRQHRKIRLIECRRNRFVRFHRLINTPFTLDISAFRRPNPALAARVARLALGAWHMVELSGSTTSGGSGSSSGRLPTGSVEPSRPAGRPGRERDDLRPEPPRTARIRQGVIRWAEVPKAGGSRPPGDNKLWGSSAEPEAAELFEIKGSGPERDLLPGDAH